MPQSGYIYILINPTLKGLVKIGKTSKTSEERAKELSSVTGVPTQFMVAYDEFFEDIDLAENHVHEVLKDMGHHVFPNKEFFDIPLKEAIAVIKNIRENFKSNINKNSELLDRQEENDDDDENKSPYSDLLEEAKNYLFGLGDYIRDTEKAVEFFDKAADLGSGEAYYELGYIANYGIDVKIDKRLALKFLKNGVDNNYLKCYLLMAEIYGDLMQPDNSEKCINKFFEKLKILGTEERLNLLDDYIDNQVDNNKKINFNKIEDYLPELIIYYQDSIAKSIKRQEKYELDGKNEFLIELQRKTIEKNRVIVGYLEKGKYNL